MVSKRCYAPGCQSLRGTGKLFKQLPKKTEYKERWLGILTRVPEVKVCPSTAFCEDHFSLDQFEKVRQDGQRRFKETAVPFFQCSNSNQKRKPLGDISCAVNRTPVSPPPRVKSQTELEVSEALLMLTHFNEPTAQINENKNTTEPVLVSEIDSLSEECVLAEANRIIENHRSLLILDEETGLFKINTDYFMGDLPTDSEVQQNVPDSLEIASNVEVALQDNCFSDVNSLSVEDWERIFQSQSAELLKVTALYEELHQKYSEVLTEHKQQSDLQLKYESTVRAKNRLTEQLKEGNYSPWLNTTQLKRIKRKTTRGIKWDSESIRLGLILKMRCGTSGYSAFVEQFPLLPSVRTLQQTVQFIRFDSFDSGPLEEVFDLMSGMVKGMSNFEKDCDIVLDEMNITEGNRYYPRTLPGA